MILYNQVDAHNIVPCWIASEKLEYGARTIRPKITTKLAEFLTQFPAVAKHPYPAATKPEVSKCIYVFPQLKIRFSKFCVFIGPTVDPTKNI
jgi:hypothetical protein